MKQPEQSYTAIETAHGFVFFTDTTEGQKNRQDFLQFMADHYFDPHFNLGPVNVYRAEGVLKDGSYVNPGEGLYPEYAYLQMDKTPEMELVYRNEMKPTWEDFGSFCHNMHCTSSHRNRNIADILEEIESKDRKLLELSKQGTASDIRQQIEETGQDKALLDKLLKQYYLSLIHISEPTRRTPISYAVFCLKKKKILKKKNNKTKLKNKPKDTLSQNHLLILKLTIKRAERI